MAVALRPRGERRGAEPGHSPPCPFRRGDVLRRDRRLRASSLIRTESGDGRAGVKTYGLQSGGAPRLGAKPLGLCGLCDYGRHAGSGRRPKHRGAGALPSCHRGPRGRSRRLADAAGGELVALLSLADGHRLPRDRVIEEFWPDLEPEAGAANLRKAIHHARRTLGDPGALALRAEGVELFPRRSVSVDVARFLRDAELALRERDPQACAKAAAAYAGELLPDSPYESWTQEPRRRAHARACELLRCAGQWEQLLELEPTDEAACRQLMQAAIDTGQRHAAIRLYERVRIALVRDVGVQPDAETRALYDRCTAGLRTDETVFVGRELELALATGQLRAVTEGRTSALLVRGPSGIGKSAFLREVAGRARAEGWRIISVSAQSSGEPYRPLSAVVEQLLVQGRPALDELPERSRAILARLTPLAPPAPALKGALTRHQVVATVQRALDVTATGA